MIDELAALGGAVRIGIDVVGGIAGLAEAMLAEAGFALVHVPGLAVNRARQGNRRRREQVRPARCPHHRRPGAHAHRPARRSSPPPRSTSRSGCWSAAAAISSRRRPSGSAACMTCSPASFPAWKRSLDLTTKGPLHLLTRYVTPAELRGAGKKRLVRHLKRRRRHPAGRSLGRCRARRRRRSRRSPSRPSA